MRSAHHLNATDLDEITRHRRLLTHQQRVALDAIHYRLEAFPQRFARSERYAQTAGLVLLSDWAYRRKFCYCSIRNGLCRLWKLCAHCSYRKRTLLLQRYLTQFSRSRWWFLTISFDGVLSLEGHVAEDMGLYWDACHKAVRPLVDDGSFLGAVKVEELHVESLLPLVVLPHCHFLIAAEDVTVGHTEQVKQLVMAHRDEAELVEVRVMTKTYPLPTVGDFARVLGYMVKPVDLVSPFLAAWPLAALNERAGVPDLNADVVEFFDGHAENCYSRHQLDYMGILDGRTGERCIAVPKATREQSAHIPAGQEHILEQEDGKKRWVQVVMELSRAFALCAASDEATEIRDDVSFFQALQAALNKQTGGSKKTPEQIDAAIRQLVSKAITTEGQVIDVFTAAGLPKPDISILSDQFLAEVRGLKHKNVAAELLEKLLKDELKVRSKRNLVQSQVFSEKLKKTLNAYHNRAISTMQVIEELIKLAKDLDAATKAGKEMGLTDDEKAFYDALASNDSAVQAMGDEKLKLIAAELITQVKKSVTIDWTLRESARARIKVMVKRILNKHGYPPDLQEEAVKTVLAQAELLCADWV